MSRFASWIILIIMAGTLAAGCAPQPAATPTSTPEPPTPTNTATPAPPTAIPLPTFTPFPSPLPGGLHVDAATDLGPISPYLYGTNYGPWVAVPYTKIPEAENAGMNIIRFPGGAWGDQNDIRHTQIDSFMGFCKLLGAIPTISVRLRNGTPEMAAALVQWVNIDKKYGVKYWSIGNEPTLYTNEGKGTYDTPQYNQEWRKIALAMKAVDPSILLLGPELHQYTPDTAKNPKDFAGRDWMTEFLKANGDLVDVVSIHRYPFPTPPTQPTSIDDLRKNASEWTDIVRNLRSLIRETTGRDIPVAITEFSTHYSAASHTDSTPDSLYNAIWLADVLGRFISEDVLIANHWMLTSNDGQGWGLIGSSKLRPSYYTYQMFKMYGTERVLSSSDIPNVSIYAAKNKAGALTVILINLADDPKDIPLTVDGVNAPFTAQVWLLDKDHKAEQQPDHPLTKSGMVTLPGQSITLLIIK